MGQSQPRITPWDSPTTDHPIGARPPTIPLVGHPFRYPTPFGTPICWSGVQPVTYPTTLPAPTLMARRSARRCPQLLLGTTPRAPPLMARRSARRSAQWDGAALESFRRFNDIEDTLRPADWEDLNGAIDTLQLEHKAHPHPLQRPQHQR